MLGTKFRNKFENPLNKIGLLIAKTGINPNIFSSFALLWAAIAAYFIANKNIIVGLMFVLLAAIWDALDGSLARMAKKVTKFGNYIDSLTDRYVEIIIYLGFALAGFYIEAFLVVTGSLLVSYAKARTALVIPIDNRDWPTIGERFERLFFLIIVMFVSTFIPDITLVGYSISSMSFFLYLIAIMVYMGGIHRIIYARNLIKRIK